MSVSPRDLILQGTWHHALFTTYSLSLAFFESHLWRGGLKKRGCREAWVIADLDGYSASISERQSRFVGHEYRLVPVALPRGVFHPKCTYLSGPDGDVLLIGSGNLTFGGHGRNIEVLEIFRASEHPGIFGEFADFLAALRARVDFINPEPAWLDRFERLARRAAGGKTSADSSSPPRLLHSANRSILDQLADFAQPLGNVTEARVLSPYFDPRAEAVAALVQRLQVPRLLIGLPPKEEEKTTFPFDRPLAAVRTIAATVSVEAASRRLHAKWIEIDFSEKHRLTLTGSVNATRQALCSSNNIEVGVLRITPSSLRSPLKWQKVATPVEIARLDFEKSGLGSRLLVHAHLTEDGRLVGRLLGVGLQSEQWRASLDLPDGEALTFDLELALDGTFSHRIPAGTRFEGAPGLQLHIQQGSLHARCWVQNDWLIELAHLGARYAAPLIALFQGDAEDEDEIAFLTFLHDGIAELAPAMAAHHAARVSSDSTAPAKARPEHMVPVSSLKPSEQDNALDDDNSLSPTSFGRSQRLAEVLDRLLREFEERPVQPPPPPHAPLAATEDLSDEEAVAETTEARPPRLQSKAHHAALFRLRETVRRYLQDEQSASTKRAVCLLWLQVELRAHLRDSPSDHVVALKFLREWFLQTARHCRWQALNDPLDERVWLIVGVVAIHAASPERVGLHEGLEDYFPASLHAELFSTPPRVPPAFTVLIPPGADLLAGVALVRAARTRRQEIAILRSCAATKPPTAPPPDLSVCLQGDGKEAHRRLSAGRPAEFRELQPGRTACPECYTPLPVSQRETLRRLRIVSCVQCDRFVIDLASHS